MGNKRIAVTWGRFNPATIGHEKLVAAVKKAAGSGTAKIFLSHSVNPKKDPLSYDDKIRFAQAAFGSVATKSPARTIIELAKQLEHEGYSELTVVVGSDRIGEFETLLNKYNGKEYHFTNISVVSAGERDPDAEGVSGMSASKMRAAASANDYTKFKSGAPSRLSEKETKEMFDKVREGMGIVEGVDLEEATDPVSFHDAKMKFHQNKQKEHEDFIAKRSNGINKKDLFKHSHLAQLHKDAAQAHEIARNQHKYKLNSDDARHYSRQANLYKITEGTDYDEGFEEFELDDTELASAFDGIDYEAVVQSAESEHLVGDDENGDEEDYEGMEGAGEEEDDVYPTCPGCENENCPDCKSSGPEEASEAVLTFQQRLQRARALRAREPKLKRLRAVAAQRFAGGKNLMRRARHAAMAIIRKKVAGNRGVHYSNLSPSEKMAIDRQIQSRMKFVGTIAKRLMPMVRKKEQARLAAARAPKPTPQKEGFEALKAVYEAKASIAAKSDDSDNGEADAHIIMLLRKSVSLRGLKDVKFNDGNTVRVPAGEAQAALNLFNSAKTSIEKGAVQKKLAASYESLKNAIGGK